MRTALKRAVKTVNKNRYPITFVNLKNEVIILKPPPDDSLWTGSCLAALFVVSSCLLKTFVVNVLGLLRGIYFRSKVLAIERLQRLAVRAHIDLYMMLNYLKGGRMESQSLINFIRELLIVPIRERSLELCFADGMADCAYGQIF